MSITTFLDTLVNQTASSFPCSFQPSFCLFQRPNRLKFAAGVRVTSFNVSPCTSSPYLFHCTTGKLPTLVEIMFPPGASWMESSSVASFKLTNSVLCRVVSHVAPVYETMMLLYNSNLLLYGNIFFGISISMNSA